MRVLVLVWNKWSVNTEELWSCLNTKQGLVIYRSCSGQLTRLTGAWPPANIAADKFEGTAPYARPNKPDQYCGKWWNDLIEIYFQHQMDLVATLLPTTVEDHDTNISCHPHHLSNHQMISYQWISLVLYPPLDSGVKAVQDTGALVRDAAADHCITCSFLTRALARTSRSCLGQTVALAHGFASRISAAWVGFSTWDVKMSLRHWERTFDNSWQQFEMK